MKTLRFVAAAMFFAALSIIPAAAQVNTTAAPAPTQTAAPRVAVINTAAFADEKAGIGKFTSAYKQLETEFQPRRTEITTMENRLKVIADDIRKFNAQQGAPVDPKTISAKQEEGEKLQREYNFKVEEYKAAVQRREAAVVGPIYNDIGKAIQDYAKQKGYSVILDISKDQTGMIVWADMASVDATTADFIKFYNARPAGTASAATPK